MSRIKIKDLNANFKDNMNDAELKQVTGGTTGGFGNDLLNADDVVGIEQQTSSTVYIGSTNGGVWRTDNAL